jgi:hypothetical protein
VPALYGWILLSLWLDPTIAMPLSILLLDWSVGPSAVPSWNLWARQQARISIAVRLVPNWPVLPERCHSRYLCCRVLLRLWGRFSH